MPVQVGLKDHKQRGSGRSQYMNVIRIVAGAGEGEGRIGIEKKPSPPPLISLIVSWDATS
jgi:hypothetical protein